MNIHEAIEIEQSRYLHRNGPVYTLVNLFAVCIFSAWLWDDAPVRRLQLWLAAAVLMSFHRLNLWHRFREFRFDHAVARRWLRRMWLGPAAASGLWAAVMLFILPGLGAAQQAVFLYGFVLYAVAAIFNYGSYYPSYLCVFTPFGTAVVVVIAAGKTTFDPLFAAVMLLFVVLIALVARRFNHIFRQSLELRFENLELVQQLTEQKEAAEAASLAKSRFLAAASHDLRQPMHAINLYLGTLAGLGLPPAAHELLGKTRQCGQAMDEMFRALLDMSRLDASAVLPEVSVFPMAAVLGRIQIQFEPEARAKGLELRIAPCSAWVHCDLSMVETIVRNFVANAVRYTERGRILVGCRRRGTRLRLAVYDTGPGIPLKHQRAVFEEFYQINNRERDRAKGLGLGLAIVQRLSKLLSVPIELASQPGRGSMFAVDLPRSSADQRFAAPLGTMKLAARTDLAGMAIAVIDDEEPILDATRALLETWGCAVVTAASGKEAIDRLILEPRAPDAIICDYRLRGTEDGINVIAMLRGEFNADIPAVLITGDTAPARIQEIKASNMPVLHKPIDAEILWGALSEALASKLAS